MTPSQRRSLDSWGLSEPILHFFPIWMRSDVSNDATSGYVLQQQIYTGKNVEQRMPEVGLGTRVVLDLTQGYIADIDNFYTSPTLAQKLLQKGISSLGIVKGNNRGLPKELVFPQKPKPARGSSS